MIRMATLISGHLRLSKPGARTVFAPGTPSDWRSWRNAQRDMRQALEPRLDAI
jgi:hypothetical protein